MSGPESETGDEKTADLTVAKINGDKKEPDSPPIDMYLSDSDGSPADSKSNLAEESEKPSGSKTGTKLAEKAEVTESEMKESEAEAKEPETPKAETKPEQKEAEAKEPESAKSETKSEEKAAEAKEQESPKSESSTTSEVKSEASQSEKEEASSLTLTQHHVSHLLSDVLEDDTEGSSVIRNLRFPMILDCLLALGLLVAVGGFTIGLFHMYLIHSASQSISEQRYKTAIVLLKGAPMPQVFARPGSDTEELLSKALYLDAMDKLEAGTDLEEALRELGEIKAGSRYFALAQEAISENSEPAPVMLQGGASTTETAVPAPKQSLLEKTLKEEEHK